ncbi:MAG: sodium:proton antiporter, partial [Clostridia bacterium]|nr:sodium:proton antiporter [Clostridia bacterium]
VNADKNIKKYLGLTLLPQAGVAVGMAQIAITALPAYGASIRTIVLCATLIYELIGPIITKAALTKAGEITNVKPLKAKKI